MSQSNIHNFLRVLMLPLEQIDQQLPKSGKIVDLGCGEGVIASYLAKNKKRQLIGVDLNAKRIPQSKQKNLKFENGDIRKYKTAKIAGAVISDVLHHLDYGDQKLVLKNVFKNLSGGGVLVIKEINTGEFLRSTLSRFWDFVFYPKDKIYYHEEREFKKYLIKLGFSVKTQRASRLFPGSTTLFICRKI